MPIWLYSTVQEKKERFYEMTEKVKVMNDNWLIFTAKRMYVRTIFLDFSHGMIKFVDVFDCDDGKWTI